MRKEGGHFASGHWRHLRKRSNAGTRRNHLALGLTKYHRHKRLRLEHGNRSDLVLNETM